MSLKPKNINFNDLWFLLKSAIERILNLGKVTRREWNDRFSDVYAICVAFPEPLGDRLYYETKCYLENHVRDLFQRVKASDDLLLCYYHQWKGFNEGMKYLNHLYMYLNIQHIKKQRFSEADLQYGRGDHLNQMLEIGELGLDLWRQYMIEALKEDLVALLLEGIEGDRLRKEPNANIYQGVILSFVEVGEYLKEDNNEIYEKIFEERFLRNTGMYYELAASRLLQENDCSQYMEKVLHLIDEEDLRSHKFLHPSSFPKVKQECENRMVADHMQFLHGECKRMVKQECRKDLRNMYSLLKSIPNGTEALVQEIQKHITQIGLEIVNNLRGDNVPQLFVESLLSLHAKYALLIKEVFSGDQQFVGALDKASTAVINYKTDPKFACRSPELLAKYCDFLLKKNAKGMSENEIEDRLSQSIIIFKYLDDKDVFQKFYGKMLAKRLIYNQSVSMEAEESMINKLKLTCGYEFTSKLHRMFTDMSVSSDLCFKFYSYLSEKFIDINLNFNVVILQAGSWPLANAPVSPFAIPQQLERSVKEFEIFYRSQFNGRKLTWLHHLCSTEVKLCYLKKSYIVTMSTYQMAILLLYEKTDSLSYTEIQESTRLNDEQLGKQIQSLLEAKLLLGDHDKTSEPESIFVLNKDYSNKRTKFKLTAVVPKETSHQEIEQTQVSMEEDRKLYLQAAIVRIMKSRKVLRHNALIQEVIDLAKNRFIPNVSMIKKCIESLIDKQYIERTPKSNDEYSYVA